MNGGENYLVAGATAQAFAGCPDRRDGVPAIVERCGESSPHPQKNRRQKGREKGKKKEGLRG